MEAATTEQFLEHQHLMLVNHCEFLEEVLRQWVPSNLEILYFLFKLWQCNMKDLIWTRHHRLLVLLQSIISSGVSGPIFMVYEHIISTILLSLLACFLERGKRPPLSQNILLGVLVGFHP
ncbi:uncharacterized protein LOC122074708 [Macadamia integrifolia]|uniref:uncharacterized protein LOC122074708 n=1 Tax=Macadamia integrifolia TaxID=60698 RepID=UPI001C4FE66E|nr:uncharacterized protein LOC122074708 [Macadamia integrifolia]